MCLRMQLIPLFSIGFERFVLWKWLKLSSCELWEGASYEFKSKRGWVLVGKKQNKTKKKVSFQKLRKTKNCDDNSWFVFLPRSVYNEDEWFKAHNLGYNWAPPNELEMILISKFLINPYQFLQSLRRSFRNQPPKKATSQMRKTKMFWS